MKICHVVGAGAFNADAFKPTDNDYVIAADGGYSYCLSCGRHPDLVVGDFDSLGAAPVHNNVLTFPAEKDETDTMIAVDKAIELGYDCIMLHGSTQGRADHTLANFQTLYHIAEKGCVGFMLGTDFFACSINGRRLVFDKGTRGYISVFSMGGEVSGITLKGLKYPLSNGKLLTGSTLGTSNEFKEEPAEISAKCGILTVVWMDTASKLPKVEAM